MAGDPGASGAGAATPPSREAVLAAADYPSFARLLRASGCRACALAEGRTNIVVDRGNTGAAIMAIGEGPGEREDLEGQAFVGRAGKLLDELLRAVGIDPGRHLLIANVVKCRPPANRVPQPGEVAACLPYLRRQIALVQPHTVLLLGATALRHLAHAKGALSMEKAVGKPVSLPEYPGVAFTPLYHPAYLLRDPRKKPVALGHLEALRDRLRAEGALPRT